MKDRQKKSVSIEEAKRIAAGPLGKEMARFPMLFAKPIFLAIPPHKASGLKVNSGTISLVDLGHGPVGITCFHVMSYFKKLLKESSKAVFQVANLKFNPLSQIISEDETLDLITLKFTEKQAKTISDDGEIGTCFFQPHSWPPNKIKEGEFIAFGGFPGVWRQQLSTDEFMFDTFSSGASPISAVGENHFVCQFERENWINSFNPYHRDELHDLGGLSGSPVFIKRNLYWEFVGIIYEFSSELDLMYIRPTQFIAIDGKILPQIGSSK